MVMKHSVESFSSDFSITTLIKGKVRYAQDRTTVPTRHLVRKCQMKCNLFFSFQVVKVCGSLGKNLYSQMKEQILTTINVLWPLT